MELLEDIPIERQEKALDDIAHKIVRFGFVTPAIMFLEMNKPLNFLGSQMMLFMEPLAQPLARMIFSYPNYHALTMMLEKRENIEKLIQKIEDLSEQQKIEFKKAKEEKRKCQKTLK